MGGGTVLEYCAINRYAKFIIADCPYSDLKELMKHQISKLNHLPVYPLLFFVDLMLRVKAGYRLKDVSPIKAVRDSRIPIMLIHGGEDDFVPLKMSVDMFKARKDNKRLLIIDSAKHGMSYSIASEKYEREVMKFVESVVSGQ